MTRATTHNEVSLPEIIRAGVIALDISDADADMLEGVVIDGMTYDLTETPELWRTIRGMYVTDPDTSSDTDTSDERP